ncbi:hypothetical protein A3I99_00090 [Candidatus Kaiserbacteria bacterium RIFCSPLOWO2_02_FULL_45_11b]|uniref:Uncharacterized protein n=1 Tax=Candidatus Kaiserbacteria bacterium RIFCSPLOWO2_12_FULL_45_26 TaxID=1798525 RepID=A0A1F6FGI5_9BACT|nr:MAG: hypothetical protein A2Z56_02950 [Candidatus Kaiserbacteria bacterium RIFCSPHIGHO2_12_45_16]OGG71033.1 MAG: hypothetical protein A2929_01750 [Candidatus Kaiserbacteria bacterium RIFCSPLOWO2_01_FULL_45_25]OGG84188.1 MAG: hypothetical protein A3I99_00090 [Candidatus Kaiserbacteria bacterium RIFCSPLOWO2_02_FULL_45_11b]OGG84959.1 MAG: hypothetical protein A3G90_02740 [Candidatus Kaiserbacteria bacterium RIFCSPLOWO2_12_FULL_45_26]
MSYAIEFAETNEELEAADLPAPHMLVVTTELLGFIQQFEDLRPFGTRLYARTVNKLPFYQEEGMTLSVDEWFALRHAVVEFLVTAKGTRHTCDFLIIKPVYDTRLKNTRKGNLFSRQAAHNLIKGILGNSATDDACAAFMSENFFRPQDFIGEFDLTDFTL